MADPQVLDIIRNTASQYGLDPATMVASAGIESNFNPRLANPRSSARGLFQQMVHPGGSWQEYGRGGDVYDPQANTDATARQWVDNISHFKNKMGREPTPGETYLMHQQGRAGAVALLQNPDMSVTQALHPFYKDPAVLYKAITLNGGNLNMSAGDFANLWTKKLEGRLGQEPGQSLPSTQVATSQGGGTPAAATGASPAFGSLAPQQQQQQQQVPNLTAAMEMINKGSEGAPVQPFTPQVPISVLRGRMARIAGGGGGMT